MLNLNCAICADLLSGTDDVYVTKCGHLFHYSCLCQWLERSKTCPQCRNKCTDSNMHRVYFNLANLDTSKVDVGSLQEQLDNAKLKIKISEDDLRKAEAKINTLKDIQKKCMKTISSLEQKLQKDEFLITSYHEQLAMLRAQANETEVLRKEVKHLKGQIETLGNLSSILTSTAEDTEKLLKEEHNAVTLAGWVTALKRELRICESKRIDQRNVLKVVQNDMRKEVDLRKAKEARICELESDNYNLKQKLKSLESEGGERVNQTTLEESPSTSTITRKNAIDAVQKETSRLTISPNTMERVRKIETSKSPYLNIKSSGVPINMLGLGPKKPSDSESLSNGERFNDLSNKYSFLKRRRVTVLPTSISAALKPGFTYNGLGGTEKEPIFQDKEDNLPKKAICPSLSNRLKSGKLRRFPSAGTENIEKFLNKN